MLSALNLSPVLADVAQSHALLVVLALDDSLHRWGIVRFESTLGLREPFVLERPRLERDVVEVWRAGLLIITLQRHGVGSLANVVPDEIRGPDRPLADLNLVSKALDGLLLVQGRAHLRRGQVVRGPRLRQ